jgi:hypothetical protein
MSDPKKMTVKEFRELGYLQELNRKFLHPLGLAIEVYISSDGQERFGEPWDYRDEPEGLTFAKGMIDPEKVARIWNEQEMKKASRERRLGFEIQPPGQ